MHIFPSNTRVNYFHDSRRFDDSEFGKLEQPGSIFMEREEPMTQPTKLPLDLEMELISGEINGYQTHGQRRLLNPVSGIA
jgi:hypothetical protein